MRAHTVIPIGLYLLQKIQALSLKNGLNNCSVPKLYSIQYHAKKTTTVYSSPESDY